MKHFQLRSLVLALPILLAACGGGGDNTTAKVSISSVVVFGDSLQDSGTFTNPVDQSPLKFTVNGSETRIFPERVAQLYGINSLCAHYAGDLTSGAVVAGTNAACTNYAVGNGRINSAPFDGTGASPYSVLQQLSDATAASGYKGSELLVIDGGGNDSADLVGAFLLASSDGGAAIGGLFASLGVTLNPDDFSASGQAYMTKLADVLQAQVKAQALDKGARRVVIVNIPGILNTPRFQMVLAGLTQQVGAEQTAIYQAMFNGWIQAFNARIAAVNAAESRVAVVDLYTEFNNQIANPAQFRLSNVVTPACPVTGVGDDGLPTYTFPTCTSTALSAAIPTGETLPNWWQSYAFADGFHPTPYGHQLVSQLISRSLARAGWL